MPAQSWAIRTANSTGFGVDASQSGNILYITISKYRQTAYANDATTLTLTSSNAAGGGTTGSSTNNNFPSSSAQNTWLGTDITNWAFTIPYNTSVINFTFTYNGTLAQQNNPHGFSIGVTPVYQAPAAPTGLAVARVSDTQQNLTWTAQATANAPYNTVYQVQRAELSGSTWGGWTAIANLAGTSGSGAASYSDTSTAANKGYKYRIRVGNSAGEAYSGESSFAFTTPSAPTSLTATKLSNTSIKLDLVQAITHTFYQTALEYSTDAGATWTALTTLNSSTQTYQWDEVPAATVIKFRAKVTIVSAGAQGNGLASGYTESASVPLAAPPNAPSALSPNGVAFDAATAQLFSWQHNPTDTTAQSAYEIQYRIVGAGAWTSMGKVTSATSSRNVAANTFTNGHNYEWQVRTWGLASTGGSEGTGASPWSATATYTTSTPPTCTVTSPTDPWTSAVATAAWTYYDSEATAQSAWQAQLIQGGNLLENLNGNGAATGAVFATRLQDATTYTVQVRVRDGSGLWSAWDPTTFTTDFPTPEIPTLTADWSVETGEAVLQVTNPDDVITLVRNDLMRSLDGGITWELVDTTPPSGTGFDRTVPLGLDDVMYKAVAWSDLPSSTESAPVTMSTDYPAEGGYWSAGDDFGTLLRMKQGYKAPPKIDLTTGEETKVLHYYAGRKSAVETMGEAVVRQGKVSFLVLTVEEMRQARAMALLPAPHLFRLPDGTTVFSSVGPVSDSRLQQGAYTITFDITEVDQ